MHKSARLFALAPAALLVLSGPAMAQPTGTPSAGNLTFAITGGVEFAVDGDVHGGGDVPVADLGALNPDLAGVAATLQIGSRDYDQVYGELWTLGGEIGYGLDASSEIFFHLGYTEASGGQLQVGTAAVPALAAELPVFGRFDDYSAWTAEVGYRYYMTGMGSFIPYAGVRGGLAFVDGIGATFTIPDAAIALNDVAFYKSSEVLTAGLELGVIFPISDTLGLGVQTGLTWSDKLSDDDSDIGGLGLGGINNEGDRLSIPVKAVLRGRF